ncbi:helix-turn-helix transcriptional regulator [Embleya hyalina]|nr:helix-turn-helix transcriptional regulator [Embleya hyalina]
MGRAQRSAMWRQIVRVAVEREFCGPWLLGELRRQGFEVAAERLSAMLRRMEGDGTLVSEHRTVDGQRRRMYRASAATRERAARE